MYVFSCAKQTIAGKVLCEGTMQTMRKNNNSTYLIPLVGQMSAIETMEKGIFFKFFG